MHSHYIVRALVATLCVAGCSFEPGSPEAQPGGGGSQQEPEPDPTLDAGAMPMPTPRACQVGDPSIRLCLEVDDGERDPMLDASSMQLEVHTSNTVALLRRAAEPAVGISFGSVEIPELSYLDIATAITIEMWIQIPSRQWSGLIANDGQYKLAIEDRAIGCSIGSTKALTSSDVIPDANWYHVACTYDGTRIRVFVNGELRDCQDRTGAIPTGGGNGTRLMGGFTGGFDEIHVHDRALAPAEICTRADRTGCNSTCGS